MANIVDYPSLIQATSEKVAAAASKLRISQDVYMASISPVESSLQRIMNEEKKVSSKNQDSFYSVEMTTSMVSENPYKVTVSRVNEWDRQSKNLFTENIPDLKPESVARIMETFHDMTSIPLPASAADFKSLGDTLEKTIQREMQQYDEISKGKGFSKEGENKTGVLPYKLSFDKETNSYQVDVALKKSDLIAQEFDSIAKNYGSDTTDVNSERMSTARFGSAESAWAFLAGLNDRINFGREYQDENKNFTIYGKTIPSSVVPEPAFLSVVPRERLDMIAHSLGGGIGMVDISDNHYEPEFVKAYQFLNMRDQSHFLVQASAAYNLEQQYQNQLKEEMSNNKTIKNMDNPVEKAKAAQLDILVKGLEDAVNDKEGVFVNRSEKTAPRIYEQENSFAVTPFNKLILALYSDQHEFKTNSFTTFKSASERNESIRLHQSGVPYTWQTIKGYSSKDNPEETISKKDFQSLPVADKMKYAPVHEDRYMNLFNIEQSTLPSKDREKFQQEVDRNGSYENRKSADLANIPEDKVAWYLQQDNVKLRHEVNQFLQTVNNNLVPVHRNGMGLSTYDAQKDVINLPLQKVFSTYQDYVQDAARQIAISTGHTQRLNRTASTEEANVRNQLVYELASATKMLDFGLSAKLSPEAQKMVPQWVQLLKENPDMADEVIHDVNRTLNMIDKAANGQKIERNERAELNLDSLVNGEGQGQSRYSLVNMLKDDAGDWTLFARREDGVSFATHPSKEDVGIFFNALRNGETASKVDAVRLSLASKYEEAVAKDPSRAVELFKSNASKEALDLISSVKVFRSGREGAVPLVTATIGDESMKARVVPKDLYQRLFLADNQEDYKKHIVATVFADKVASKIEEVKQANSPKVDGTSQHEQMERAQNEAAKQKAAEEAKRQEEQRKQQEKQKQEEEKAKREVTKAETKAVAAVALSPMMKQFLDLKHKHPDALLLFRTGDFYETYKQDAEKASRILGITLTKSSKTKDEEGKPLTMAGFPYHALDTYLPKLIRAGERVAICDQLEAPKQTASRGITEMVSPGIAETKSEDMKEAQTQQQEQKQKQEEERHRGGFHL